MRWDVLIRNGLVIDGTGGEPFAADVAIRDDTIDVIEQLPVSAEENARMLIDASGMVIAPGFIDVHGHTDYELLVNPTAESKVMQGITTEISGNCGFSVAPVLCDMLRRDQDAWCARHGVDVRWQTFAEFFDIVEAHGIGINYATLVGHGVLRANVMNYEARLPSDEELKQMTNMLVEALEHGAIGMSSGLIYPPGCYAQTDELIALCRTLRRYDGIYATHIRDECAELIPALREAIEISRESGVPLEISHHKAVGQANWGKVHETLSIIERANFWGLDVTCDQYPYIATFTSLKTLIPKWAHEGGNEQLLRRLAEANALARIRMQVEKRYPTDDAWHAVMIAEVVAEHLKEFEGMRIDEIANELNMAPFEALIHLLCEDGAQSTMIVFALNEDDVIEVMRYHRTLFGTDAAARQFTCKLSKGKPHPRAFGTFPRILGRYVREKQVLTLPEAIKRMTSLPAHKFRLNGRGVLKPGYFADIVIFDPKRICDRSTFDYPQQPPDGIHHVLVNGVPVVTDGKLTGALPGRILRR